MDQLNLETTVTVQLVTIDGVSYRVNRNEYMNTTHHEYNNLTILNGLGRDQRLVGLIRELAAVATGAAATTPPSAIFTGVQHGGYVALNTAAAFETVNCFTEDKVTELNMKANAEAQGVKNLLIADSSHHEGKRWVFFIDEPTTINANMIQTIGVYQPIMVSKALTLPATIASGYTLYTLSGTSLFVFVPKPLAAAFQSRLGVFVKKSTDAAVLSTLEYDNLLHLVMIVKNGAEFMEKMLRTNMASFDEWTILDTGSTDDTVAIIKRVLVGKKKGRLVQEPFINFRDSRNRAFELAGTSCTYNLVLDDTYELRGNVRGFLRDIRGDQYADSFSMYISSHDNQYISNRITRSCRGLRYIYRIHEVIDPKDNVNVCLPVGAASIFDIRSEKMQQRTISRKPYDIEMLQLDLAELPDDPRSLYYLGQTYALMGQHEQAYEYYMLRVEHTVEGFLQEKIDACFEAARLANFQLNKPWKECKALYQRAYEMDHERPESLYFIGIHYYLKSKEEKNEIVLRNAATPEYDPLDDSVRHDAKPKKADVDIAYSYLSRAFEIGYPLHRQYALKPTLSYHFVPKFLAEMCYTRKRTDADPEYVIDGSMSKVKIDDYALGEKAADLFLEKNKSDADGYETMVAWKALFKKLNEYHVSVAPTGKDMPNTSVKHFIYVADGGFQDWTGSDILTKGLGGSETYLVEMSAYLAEFSDYDVSVFCKCAHQETFRKVTYRPLASLGGFLKANASTGSPVQHAVIYRFSEYLPVAIEAKIKNIYLVLQDLNPTGNVIPNGPLLKKIFLMTPWHETLFHQNFPTLKHLTVVGTNGIHVRDYTSVPVEFAELSVSDALEHMKKWEMKPGPLDDVNVVPFRFMYSSFPNRGLLILLQMWRSIVGRYPTATLEVYCDVTEETANGRWANTTFPEEMARIRTLLGALSAYGVNVHRFVPKKELARAWKTADVWFYPCTFAETSCITAMEAQISKTLVVCNDLGALVDTVGDRGIMIKGDVRSIEWQNEALSRLFDVLDHPEKKQALLVKGYKWARGMEWKRVAVRFLNTIGYDQATPDFDKDDAEIEKLKKKAGSQRH